MKAKKAITRTKTKVSKVKQGQNSILSVGIDLEDTAHHFLVNVPSGNESKVCISEHDESFENQERQKIEYNLSETDVRVRVLLPLEKWNAISEAVSFEFSERLNRLGMKSVIFQVGLNQLSRLFGKELVLLAWAIEDADPGTIPKAIENWRGLKPQERWWLYTMTNAATGQAVKHKNIGWRKAVRFALTENPLEL
ncbi:DUF3780 domain-containing protein [Leptospira biflexa]|uniref:DUF3780 domain-containing protein n=1 Tax=Leptospira biflexa TaxID=172 RepID=UPI001FEE88D6|nr:DUF3780 domain-containing protein [Leptospira biflexa]